MGARSRLVDRLRVHLLRQGLPRLEMLVIVCGTGLAGFAASVLLLAAGITSMALRYPLAVLIAYAVFLCLLRLWVEFHRRRLLSGSDFLEVFPELKTNSGKAAGGESWSGGGQFGGGGATRAWDAGQVHGSAAPTAAAVDVPAPAGETASVAISDLDVDGTWVIVLPVVMIGAAVLGAVYVVSAAPGLMAEVLLDVLLVSGLYRRLRKLERHSWLRSAFRRTWIPVMTAAVIVAAAGFTMQVISPQADTLGDVLGAGQDGPPSQR